MRLIHDERSLYKVTLDGEAYEAFLRELNVPEEEIARLVVRIIPFVPRSPGFRGHYCHEERTIGLATLNGVACQQVNRILLHETRHFLQAVHGLYYPWDESLPYMERPHEVDAYAWAKEQANRKFVQGVVRNTSTWLQDWWVTEKRPRCDDL